MNHIMLDLETLDTRPTALILSIGAQEFDPDTGTLGRTFYEEVAWESCERAGLTISADMVAWWVAQNVGAKCVFKRPGGKTKLGLREALTAFQDFVPPNTPVWGNGADFDQVILGNAYRVLSMTPPWRYRECRCYKTFKRVFTQVRRDDTIGAAHNALDDARNQARHLCEIFNYLQGAHV